MISNLFSTVLLVLAVVAFGVATAQPYTPEPRRVRVVSMGLMLWALSSLLSRL